MVVLSVSTKHPSEDLVAEEEASVAAVEAVVEGEQIC
jgi:hypothetical protein